jgi:uncharacterized membrane protein
LKSSTELSHERTDGHWIALKVSWIPLLCFLVLASFQATWFIARVGPLTVPDPDIHALASYALATGQSLNQTVQEQDKFGNPVKVQHIHGDPRYLHIEGRRGVLASTAIVISRQGDSGREGQRAGAEVTASSVSIPSSRYPNRSNQYFPLLYLPQAIGLRIALWTDLPAYEGWQLSRITNFLAFILIWGFAIVLAPRGKMLIMCIGVLPLSVFVASSLMIDGLVMSLVALFVSMLLRYISNNRALSYSQSASLVAICILLICAKIVYFPIVIAVLALPPSVLSKRSKILLSCIWVAVVSLIFVPWYMNYSGTLAVTNIADNLTFIGTHPVHVLSIILNNVLKLPLHLPKAAMAQILCVFVLWFSTLIVLKPSENSGRLRHWIPEPRYIAIAVSSALITVCAMMLFLCLTWNQLSTLQNNAIAGFQERYLLPLLPLLALALAEKSKPRNPMQAFKGVHQDVPAIGPEDAKLRVG